MRSLPHCNPTCFLVSMMHQQSATPHYSSAQAGSQHYQGQQAMGMMGQGSQGNSMMSQRPMGSYRSSQQGRWEVISPCFFDLAVHSACLIAVCLSAEVQMEVCAGVCGSWLDYGLSVTLDASLQVSRWLVCCGSSWYVFSWLNGVN